MTHLNFDSRGNFRILQLTDIHLDTSKNLDGLEKTLSLIRSASADTEPNLIVFTGDLAWGPGAEQALDILARTMEKIGIAWAPVLGNHDGAPKDGSIKSREDFADILSGMKYSLFEKSTDGVDGHGNYIITVGDSEPEWALFMLDSHTGEFLPSQLYWYTHSSADMPESHSELAFFHVPFPEYAEVWDYCPCKGYNMEGVCSTRYNDGLFAAMARTGKMRGVFVGHDHINDFEGTLDGIRLCYGRGSGYQPYGLEGYAKGARIIDLEHSKNDFHTAIYLDTGEIYEQIRYGKPRINRP